MGQSAKSSRLLEKLLAVLRPWGQTVPNAAVVFGRSVHRACPRELTRAWVSRDFTGTPTDGGLAAAWPTFVSSRSEGHGPKAPTVNQSLGCPVWSRLLQVNKDPQQTGCSEGLESPRESRAKASPASCGQVRPPLRLSVHSQAGASGEQGRGASSTRAAEKSLRVLE